ncbi:MAG: hypothetical protein RRY22_01945 [Bacilli bacterium]
MKYILKSPIFFIVFIFPIIFGVFIGYNVRTDFYESYRAIFMLPIIRYSLIVMILTVYFTIDNLLSNSIFVLRNKNLFNSLFYVFKIELLLFLMVFILINIPIILFNIMNFEKIITVVFKMIFNGVLISIIIVNIVKLLNIFFKNRSLSIGIFLGIWSILDFLLEHFNWFGNSQSICDFSYIFVLPFVYNWYFIDFILIMFFLFSTSIQFFLGIKNDCFLAEVNYEES